MVALPGVTAVANPLAVIEALAVEDQVTAPVMSFMLWSA
jgi:hypothetical protein